MLSGASLLDPTLINSIGHTAGVLLFALIVGLLVRDRQARGIRPIGLSLLAAGLALLWNAGSLIAIASPNPKSILIGIVMTISFSALSLLPAVLLQVTLRGQEPALTTAGYGVSAVAMALHISEVFAPSALRHQLGLVLIALGFGVLTLIALAARWRAKTGKALPAPEWLSLASLLLFTSSFLHFGYQHLDAPWTAEIAWHHLGIPVVLIVLLQDYRFLLLDTFVRFLVNSALAVLYVAAVFLANKRFRISEHAGRSGFGTGLALAGLCLSLILFAHVRNSVQRWIGRVIFRRKNLDECIRNIGRSAAAVRSEEELLNGAAREIGAHLRTDEFSIIRAPEASDESDRPALLLGHQAQNQGVRPLWAEVQVPLRFSSGETYFLLTGSRRGRQRYLSEDLEDMRRLGAVVIEQVERFRSQELRRLATQAELSALQAQINPHFLFNALNTLYGSIDRNSYEARRMVLNLAEIFRYFLQGDRTFIPLSEELRIVQAYLEIETLRLGDRLETKMQIEESMRGAMIPILCIQPIVENAVKHGIVPKQGRGRVTLRAGNSRGNLQVTVEDTGVGFEASKAQQFRGGTGMGLENVRRRLYLSFGPEATLTIRSAENGSTVSMVIPASREQPGVNAGVHAKV